MAGGADFNQGLAAALTEPPLVSSVPWWYKYLRSPLCQKQSFYASKRSIYDSKLSICQLGDYQNTLFYVIYSSGWKNRNIHAWRTWFWVSSRDLWSGRLFDFVPNLQKLICIPAKKYLSFTKNFAFQSRDATVCPFDLSVWLLAKLELFDQISFIISSSTKFNFALSE